MGKPKQIFTPRGPRLVLDHSVVYDYAIQERDGERFIVETYKCNRLVTIDRAKEPDIFLRFAELDKTDEAILDFVSTYGLLGLDRETIAEIRDYQRRFKTALDWAESYIREPGADNYQWLLNWLDRQIQSHTRMELHDLSGHVTLIAESLIGAMVLQLYRFVLRGESVKICLLPGCDVHTTRLKFCSDEHYNAFNLWKNRGQVVFENGEWRKLPPKKRGRPPKTTKGE